MDPQSKELLKTHRKRKKNPTATAPRGAGRLGGDVQAVTSPSAAADVAVI